MASTYVNNLRLNEMATGDQSGSWGTVTNLNLELIGEALAWGTRAIANASTDNITIGDGAADADRSMALKLTGGGQACTVTILPNTSSKVWIMENATAATLTFSGGSGANVAILAGETKMIATDGLGTGGVVYDVLTDLNLAGTTKTAALVNAGALTAGGDITRGGTVIGDGSITDTGDYTIDVAGDIILDADGGDINIKDGGTEFARIINSSTDLVIKTIAQDRDFILKGNDGGSEITALTVDMSDAGAAAFNGKITADAGIDIDNFNIDGTTIALSSGDMTLDAAGDIILDAAGGDIFLKEAGTHYGSIKRNNNDLQIHSETSDEDMLFVGNDGGNIITALTLDMSAAGAAIFNNDVTAFSDERLKSNITTIPDALSKVTEMRGVHYVRDATGKDSTGVIAQELQKIAPELVLTAEDEMGTLSVNYGNITGYLIEAIKELKAEIEELKAR